MHKFKVTDKSGNQYIACEDTAVETVKDETVEAVEESKEVETETTDAKAKAPKSEFTVKEITSALKDLDENATVKVLPIEFGEQELEIKLSLDADEDGNPVIGGIITPTEEDEDETKTEDSTDENEVETEEQSEEEKSEDETEKVEEVEEVEEKTEEEQSTVSLTEEEILALKDLAACAPALTQLITGEDLNAEKSDDINEVNFFNTNEEVVDNGESEEDDIIEDSEDDNYLEDSKASFGSVEKYADSNEDELKAQQEICSAWEKWLNDRK